MRRYYNHRQGQLPHPKLALDELTKALDGKFSQLWSAGYLQKAFGYYCDDEGWQYGDVGTEFHEHIRLITRLPYEKSFSKFLRETTEDGHVFTFIEFVYDYIAKPDPKSGRFHAGVPDRWGQYDEPCGWHFPLLLSRFNVEAGRSEWREAVNLYLPDYGSGFELSPEGEVRQLAPQGFEGLLSRPAPENAPPTNADKLDLAVRTFRRANSSREERKQAVRQLADILEWYRPQVVKVHMTDDERELFETMNKFAIRHHNQVQRDDYGDPFLEHQFYRYLAAVQLCMKLAHEEEQPTEEKATPF